MMRFFLCGSLALLCYGCAPKVAYKVDGQERRVFNTKEIYNPTIEKAVYRVLINGRLLFKGYHLSGNLILKTSPDSVTHAVFQNEMGLNFFHFSWLPRRRLLDSVWRKAYYTFKLADSFAVVSVLPQLDRPRLLTMLAADFSTLLQKCTEERSVLFVQDNPNDRIERVDGWARLPFSTYFIGNRDALVRMEHSDGQRVITSFFFPSTPYPAGLPDTVLIKHHRANFTIQLTRLQEVSSDE